MTGYCTPSPPDDHILGYLCPTICVGGGQVPVWIIRDVNDPDAALDVGDFLSLLGKKRDEVFPASFTADVNLGGDDVGAGIVEGFHFVLFVPRENRFVHRMV